MRKLPRQFLLHVRISYIKAMQEAVDLIRQEILGAPRDTARPYRGERNQILPTSRMQYVTADTFSLFQSVLFSIECRCD